MKVIKNINNNVSLCLDSKGREVIAFGKGIGFIKAPYEIPLSKVERTFYSKHDMDSDAIKDIPISIMNASIRIVDEVERTLNITLMSTAALTLADHINFAIQRQNEHILLEIPIQENLKHLYSQEMEAAQKALQIIEEETGIILQKHEAGTIALHFINNRIDGMEERVINQNILDESIKIIEADCKIIINKDSFNYSRFATHVDYLLRRTRDDKQIESVNKSMFTTLKKQYPSTYLCTLHISELFNRNLKIDLGDEEKLYLMLHINRLCSREKGIK